MLNRIPSFYPTMHQSSQTNINLSIQSTQDQPFQVWAGDQQSKQLALATLTKTL